MSKTERTAVLQMEYVKKGRGWHCQQIAKEAMEDTFERGGTFVLIVDPEKVTIVQRRDAEKIGTVRPAKNQHSTNSIEAKAQ